MKVTGIELLQKITNNEITKGFKIQCTDDWNGIYEFDGFDFKTIDGDAEIWNRYSVSNFVTTEFKILKEIEELDSSSEGTAGEFNSIKNKLNELVRAVNKLIKEREDI